MPFVHEKLRKRFETPMPFVLEKRFRSSNSMLRQMRALFSIPRLLLSKTQYSSDKTSKIWIERFTSYIGSKFRIVLKKYICEYIMRKPNFRQKMKILNESHSAKKYGRGDPLGFLKLQFVTKYHRWVPKPPGSTLHGYLSKILEKS